MATIITGIAGACPAAIERWCMTWADNAELEHRRRLVAEPWREKFLHMDTDGRVYGHFVPPTDRLGFRVTQPRVVPGTTGPFDPAPPRRRINLSPAPVSASPLTAGPDVRACWVGRHTEVIRTGGFDRNRSRIDHAVRVRNETCPGWRSANPR